MSYDGRARFHSYKSLSAALEAEAKFANDAPGPWVDSWCGNSAAHLGDLLYHDCSVLPPGAAPTELVRWNRISQDEVLDCSSPRLWPAVDAVESWSLKQGRLADAWFLNAAALLSGTETGRAALKACLVSDKFGISQGLYTVRFWKEGCWVFVHVDDRIPCDVSGLPLYSRSADPNVVWLLIIEKAYAKLHGSYLNLENGQLADGAVDLTGGVAQELRGDAFEWEALKDKLNGGTMSHALAARVLRPRDNKSAGEDRRGDGVLTGWAYALMGMYNPSKHTRLVKLADVWGRSKWKGQWSSEGPEWRENEEIKEMLNPDDEWPVGEFFMAWEDFKRIFDSITSLALCGTSDSDGGWEHCRFEGAFVPDSVMSGPGGNPNNENSWLTNPMVTFSLSDTADVAIALGQCVDHRLHDFFSLKKHRGFRKSRPSKEQRSSEEHDDADEKYVNADKDKDGTHDVEAAKSRGDVDVLDRSGLGFTLCKLGAYKCGRRRMNQVSREKIVAYSSAQFLNSRNVGCAAVSLPKGDYAIVPCTFSAGVTGSFALDVFYPSSDPKQENGENQESSAADISPDSEVLLDFHIDPRKTPRLNLSDALDALSMDDNDDDEEEKDEKNNTRQPMIKFTADNDPMCVDDLSSRGELEAHALQHMIAALF